MILKAYSFRLSIKNINDFFIFQHLLLFFNFLVTFSLLQLLFIYKGDYVYCYTSKNIFSDAWAQISYRFVRANMYIYLRSHNEAVVQLNIKIIRLMILSIISKTAIIFERSRQNYYALLFISNLRRIY